MTDTAVEAPPESAPPESTKPGRAPLNPVLAQELRIRFRGVRGWALLTVYLVLLGGILYLVYRGASGGGSDDPFAAPSPTRFADTGQAIFEWVLFFMLLLVLFLVPGFTSGAIAGERERQTLVPLQVSLLHPWQIVVGKLFASVAFLALLVVAATPFLSVAYLVGGVTTGDIVRAVGVTLFTGFVLAAFTVGCSAVFRRVQIATVFSYAIALFLALGTLVVWGAAGIIDNSRGNDSARPPAEFLALNPLFLAADLIGEDRVTDIDIGSPFNSMKRVLLESEIGTDQIVFIDEPGRGFPIEGDFGGFAPEVGVATGGGGFPATTVPGSGPVIGFDPRTGQPIFADPPNGLPFWAVSSITLYVCAVAAVFVAVRRIRTPGKVER